MSAATPDYQHRVLLAMRMYAGWCAAVFIYTLFQGCQGNVLRTSMSAMGNTGSLMHLSFVIWTIVFCGYFGSLSGFILILTQHAKSRIRILVYIAVAIMIFGDIVPFVPAEHPIMAWLHNTCAQISSVALAATLLFMTLMVRRSYPEIYRRALVWVFVIWGALLGGMSLIGTKALTEMMGILGGSLFLLVLAWDIQRAKSFDASAALSVSDALEAEETARRLEKKARELHEQYVEAEAKARHARLVAAEMQRLERRHHKESAAG